MIVFAAAFIYLPQLWLTHVMRKYGREEYGFPGTGGELARHLVTRLQLQGVIVEETKNGDHYDPGNKAVRLVPGNFSGKSLTAIVVAAHEIGHAIQHKTGYRPFRMRQSMALFALLAEKLGIILIMATPIISAISRSPQIGLISTAVAFAMLGTGVIVHLITLPVELDASFKRALPILLDGGYIEEKHYLGARKILIAAAMTYIAGSLASLVNLYRWIMILRR